MLLETPHRDRPIVAYLGDVVEYESGSVKKKVQGRRGSIKIITSHVNGGMHTPWNQDNRRAWQKAEESIAIIVFVTNRRKKRLVASSRLYYCFTILVAINYYFFF